MSPRAALQALGEHDLARVDTLSRGSISHAVGASPPDVAALLVFEELAHMTRVGAAGLCRLGTQPACLDGCAGARQCVCSQGLRCTGCSLRANVPHKQDSPPPSRPFPCHQPGVDLNFLRIPC